MSIAKISDKYEAALLDQTEELLENSGGTGIFQKMRVRMPDGSVRWISQKRLKREAVEYTDSFFRQMDLHLRAYGAQLTNDSLFPGERDIETDEELGDMKVEIMGFDVETVVEGDPIGND